MPLMLALVLEQTLNGLQYGVMLFLMAAGLTLIFGIMNLVNLAHGSLYMVGAYLATAFAENGLRVVGLDLDAQKVRAVAAGVSYIDDIDGEVLARQVALGRLRATTDAGVLSQAEAVIICVPTPFSKTKQPDLTHILSAGAQIRDHLQPGQLVILESTTYPGTTQEVLLPLLESSGLQ